MKTIHSIKEVIGVMALVALLSGCLGGQSGNGNSTGSSTSGEISSPDEAESAAMTAVENELLALINDERADLGLPELVRDEGLDLVMLWYGTDMVLDHHIGHIDVNGRDAEDRARYYGDRDDIRCSEITAWWGNGTAEDHYNAYFNSPAHHAAYIEEGIFNLGPTTHVGVVVLAGTGPEGSDFEGRSGTYSGLIFCDDSLDVVIDPFEAE